MPTKLIFIQALLLLSVPVASAEVFYAQDEAMEIAFPEADSIETRTFVIEEEELVEIERRARVAIDSKLFTFFVGIKDNEVMGYAAIDSNNVRTYPQTFMVVLDPNGQVETTLILAFHEPPEYLPSEHWLEQMDGKDLESPIRPGDDIAGILGSTLSVRAISSGVRKILALHEVLF